MKKLISALTIRQARAAGKKTIAISKKDTIITPEARMMAKDFGITFVDEQSADKTDAQADFTVNEKLIRQIVERVMDRLPPEKRNPDRVKVAVIDVLSHYKKQGANL